MTAKLFVLKPTLQSFLDTKLAWASTTKMEEGRGRLTYGGGQSTMASGRDGTRDQIFYFPTLRKPVRAPEKKRKKNKTTKKLKTTRRSGQRKERSEGRTKKPRHYYPARSALIYRILCIVCDQPSTPIFGPRPRFVGGRRIGGRRIGGAIGTGGGWGVVGGGGGRISMVVVVVGGVMVVVVDGAGGGGVG